MHTNIMEYDDDIKNDENKKKNNTQITRLERKKQFNF